MSRCKPTSPISGLDDAIKKLCAAKITLGREALNVLEASCNSAKSILDKLCIPKSNQCDIPEPCWMPKKIGEVCCLLDKCDVGKICILVSNEDFIAHDYSIQAAGEHGSLAQISRDSFTLGPKERRMVSVKFEMPKEDKPSDNSCCHRNDYEVLIWVKGCNQHYLNWYINRGKSCRDCCYELSVEDKPDYELHWYDHFHVYRPCTTPAQRDS